MPEGEVSNQLPTTKTPDVANAPVLGRPLAPIIERRENESNEAEKAAKALKEITNKTEAVHREHQDDPRFTEIFYEQTKHKIERLQTLMPDYEPKLGELPLEIIAEIEATEIAEALYEKERLREESRADPMTGLLNRRGMQERLNELQAHAQRTGEPVTLIMVDGDHFKQVNDTLGHDGGDVVIKTMAEVLKKGSREEDVVARMGGEEFVLAFANTSSDQALPAVERIRGAMHDALSNALKGKGYSDEQIQQLALTATFGIADTTGGIDIDTVLKHADVALYAAKEGEDGRNRALTFTELTRDQVDTGQLHLQDIQKAEAAAQRQREEELSHIKPTRWVGADYIPPQAQE